LGKGEITVPYLRKGKVIYHKVDGKWEVKQRCRSVEAAKGAMNLLRGVAHGWKPTGNPKRNVLARRGGT